MIRIISLIAATTMLLGGGCTSVEYSKSGLPAGYTGETATISDTFYRPGPKRAHFYYVESVDGVLVENAPVRTNQATKSYAKGERLWPISASRRVPAKELQVTIAASKTLLQPVAMFMAPSNEKPGLRETITFAPEAGERYRVRGLKAQQRYAVWMETRGGKRVSEVVGDATLYREWQKIEGVLSPPHARFLQTLGGEDGKTVRDRLGEPDEMREEQKRNHIFEYTRTIFHYDGLGLVELNDYQDQLYVEHLVPEVQLKDPELLFRYALVVPEPEKRRVASRLLHVEGPLREELLDRIALYVWLNRKSDSLQMEDAVALLCHVLTKHGEGRYNTFLQKVADTTSSRKIRRHALETMSEYIREGVEQFSVSDPEISKK